MSLEIVAKIKHIYKKSFGIQISYDCVLQIIFVFRKII